MMVAGPLLDIVDDEWRADTLPEDGERERDREREHAPTPHAPECFVMHTPAMLPLSSTVFFWVLFENPGDALVCSLDLDEIFE